MGRRTEDIAVTGAGGFIGAHLVMALLRQGRSVRAGIRSRENNILLRMLDGETPPNLAMVVADLTRPADAERLLRDARTIIHLAGVTGPENAESGVRRIFEGNVVATFNLLEVARQNDGLGRLVLASSCAAYGTNSGAQIDESRDARPASVYSATKVANEHLAESFYRSTGLPVVTLRLFNVYGPHQKRPAVIPSIISQALQDGAIRLGNLTPKRDFTYVDDVAKCFIAAIDADLSRVQGERFNIGTGVATSIGDLVDRVLSEIGGSKHVVVEAHRKRSANVDVDIVTANSAKAARILGWRPDTDVQAGLRRTIGWWRERLS